MTHRLLAVFAVLMMIPATSAAQTPERRGPPPDHWMTLDSLALALDLTAAQKTAVTEPYTALNGVLRDAAARRREIRDRMQGTFQRQPGQEPSPEMRARMDSVRAEFEGFQAEADQWLAAIRNALTPAQHAKFDALPKPQLLPRMRRGP